MLPLTLILTGQKEIFNKVFTAMASEQQMHFWHYLSDRDETREAKGSSKVPLIEVDEM